MADVFISYAHTTARQAQAAAAALRAAGYSVWLDDDLAVHREFTQAIEEQLTAAKAALVIWSADAARSAWVLSEANRAREDRKLVQLVIDRTRLPMPFDQVQCADFSGWSGDSEHANWRRVLASIGELVEGKAGASTPIRQPAPRATEPTSNEPLLAVLAFDNLSGDPEMAYFSDGVSEEIIDTVARGSDLKVIARSSSFQFRGADKAVRRVAADLKATHLLDGSVRRSGARVRVAARLVDCASDTTVWSDRFDRELTDVFDLQDEIAAAVAKALRTAFAPRADASPVDPTAYDLYLKARAGLIRGGAGDSVAAARNLELLEQAVSLAPNFGRAWAELARARAFSLRGRLLPDVTRQSAVAAAQTALSLDRSLGAAHLALSMLEPYGRYRVREALIEKALAAAPTDPEVFATMGFLSAEVGRWGDALDFARRGLELDPNDVLAANWHAVSLGALGRYQEARPLWDDCLSRWPDAEVLRINALSSAAADQDWDRVEALATGVPDPEALTQDFKDSVRYCRNLRTLDPRYQARYLAFMRTTLEKTGYAPTNLLGSLYTLGLTEETFELIEQSSYEFVFDPDGFSPSGNRASLFHFQDRRMQADPRFVGLCAKLGLCDYWVETGRWPDCADDVPYDFRAESRRLVTAR
jgi:TolB-like protein